VAVAAIVPILSKLHFQNQRLRLACRPPRHEKQEFPVLSGSGAATTGFF
jgi:hypothetical protein